MSEVDSIETEAPSGAGASRFPPGTIVGQFSRADVVRRALWYLVEATLFRFPIRRADGWRKFLLCAFGAKIGNGCLIRRNAHIEIPWNISIGDRVMLGEHCTLYSLAMIRIGSDTIISQEAYLCAGTHDYTLSNLPLVRVPLEIGARCWIGARAFVGPGVRVGEGAVLGACGVAFKDVPAWKVCAGNPARVIKDRVCTTVGDGQLFIV